MIQILLPLILLLSPTLFILWRTILQFGLTWQLLLIPIGSILAFIFMAIAGGFAYELMIKLEDQKTGSPEAGSLGAGTGRAIMSFICMILSGWIGSGLAACWIAKHWIN